MKKFLSIFALSLLLMAWGCEGGGDDVVSPDDEKTEQPDNGKDEGAVFEIDSDGNYVVEADGGAIKVKVTTNLEYSVTIPEDAKMWLSVADTRAIRNETLTFTVAKNEMTKDRHASVKIKDPDGALLQSIVFKQKYNEADESTGGPISVSKGRVSFDFEGGECELTVNAEYSWVATCTADWVTLQTPDGIAGQEPLKFIVQRNTALSERKATITLKNENYNLIQEVYVIQTEFVPIITVNEESLSLEYVACEKFIEVTSNVEYNVTDDADWLTCEVVEGGINLSVTVNRTLETRSAQVTIAAKENPEAPTTQVSVVQMPPETTQYVIYYTSSDGEIIYPQRLAGTLDFGANLIGNSYSDNQGVLMFDAPITSIGYEAFRDCSSLTSITIPDSVTWIGSRAFESCTSLTSVTIGNGVTSIGSSAFESCTSLTSITIPDSVTEIGGHAFYDCSSLTSITIPDSVTEIGWYAFLGCASLTDVYVNITDLARYAQKNALSSVPGHKHLYIKGVEITELVIPDSVTSIGGYAFSGCSLLKSITIPNSVTWIGGYAFEGCIGELIINTKIIEKDYIGNNDPNNSGWLSGSVFSNLTIGENVEKIGDYAFSGYSSLESITIPDSVRSIGDAAFLGCASLTDVYVNITDLARYAQKNALSSVPGHKHLYIKGVEITELVIPDSVTSIGGCAFRDCSSLTSVTIGNGVTEIGSSAFEYCSLLTSVIIPDSVTEIGGYAFYDCSSLTSVFIGNSVISIGHSAFRYCSLLTSITIPDSVRSIGDAAFHGCTSLEEVYCKPTTPPTGSTDMFTYYSDKTYWSIGCKIYVPSASVDAYKSASYWSNYAKYIIGYDF